VSHPILSHDRTNVLTNHCVAYNCPVVTCNKSFAVRSNARRHLKTHGIKLKTRDRGSKGKPRIESSPQDEENDDETDDDADMEPSDAPYPAMSRVSSIPGRTLAKPPDQGLGVASHRGHVNSATNVHKEPFGLGTSVSLIKDGYSGTVLERVKRGKASEKRERWEMEMSPNMKLRTVRKGVAAGRSRRGLRSEDLVAKAKQTTDGDETAQEDEGEPQTVHELEEDALLRLCPVREVPSTPQMPQLDRDDLDKLIAPPLAWDGFQKQKMLQESGQALTLEQRLAFHAGTSGSGNMSQLPFASIAPKENSTTLSAEQSTSPANVHSLRRGSTTTMASTLESTPSTLFTTPAEADETQRAPENLGSTAPQGLTSMDNRPTWTGGSGASGDLRSPFSSFLTSSMRTSAATLGPVSLVPQPPDAGATTESDPSSRDHPTPSPRFQSGIANPSSLSPGSGSGEEARGSLRDDGTWVSASMSAFTNMDRLRNSEPFDDLGLSSVQLPIPLPGEWRF
jgi:hypothetical protein